MADPEKHPRSERLSFEELLLHVDAPPPIPGRYTLEPPDVIPVADPLAAANRAAEVRKRELRLKVGAVTLSVGLGAFLAWMPTRPVDPAPEGAFSDAEVTADVLPQLKGAEPASAQPAPPVPAPEPAETGVEPPHVTRLAPVDVDTESSQPLPGPAEEPNETNESKREEHRPAARSRLHDEPQAKTGEPTVVAVLRPAPQADARPVPAQPQREDVVAALESVALDVRGCAPAYSGAVVRVRVTFAPSGRVTTAVVSGRLAGTPEGSCVARAVRAARVPPFERSSFVVAYPYRL